MNKQVTITEKHIAAIADKNVLVVISLFGNCQGRIPGKVTERLRNRFKQFVFTPKFPFMDIIFSVGDVEKIDITDDGVTLTLNQVVEAPKRRRKKKKSLPVINISG